MLQILFATLLTVPFPMNQDEKQVAWQFFVDRASILHYLQNKPKGFEVQISRPEEWELGNSSIRVRILKEGKAIHKWDSHTEGAFVFVGSTVVYSDHHPNAPGCRLIAWDLKESKQLWATSLKAVPALDTSQYQNQINMTIEEGQITVFGNESYGQYIETVDLKSGKTTSHLLGTREGQRFVDKESQEK